MDRHLISQASPFEEKIGYSRAVVQGDWVFVAGTTGCDYKTMCISDDVVEQTPPVFEIPSKAHSAKLAEIRFTRQLPWLLI